MEHLYSRARSILSSDRYPDDPAPSLCVLSSAPESEYKYRGSLKTYSSEAMKERKTPPLSPKRAIFCHQISTSPDGEFIISTYLQCCQKTSPNSELQWGVGNNGGCVNKHNRKVMMFVPQINDNNVAHKYPIILSPYVNSFDINGKLYIME